MAILGVKTNRERGEREIASISEKNTNDEERGLGEGIFGAPSLQTSRFFVNFQGERSYGNNQISGVA